VKDVEEKNGTPPKRKYPPLYEIIVPSLLVIITVALLVLLVTALAVSFGLIPSAK
jgi:hypothetical protein